MTNPFVGLRAFESEERHLFFGRDDQSSDLAQRLADRRFVAVVGASGSGKSSLVRAGLIPLLEGGFMASAGSAWRIAIMRPGRNPINALAAAISGVDVLGSTDVSADLRTPLLEAVLRRSALGLIDACRQARLPSSENLLIVVDQFEELFRLESKEAASEQSTGNAAFVNLLLEAVQQKDAEQRDVQIFVVLTMRSDFFGDCARYRDLPEQLNDSQYLVPRLTRAQRRAMIEGPIAVSGATIAPRLTQRLLNDVGEDPDALPVLQHTLMRTWDSWHENGERSAPIDIENYRMIGGLAGALSMHADQGYASLERSAVAQRTAQTLFRRLCERGKMRRDIRRPTTMAELCAVTETDLTQISEVIDEFRRYGRTFLTPAWPVKVTADTTIDISHESLIRQWGLLRNWVELEAESGALYNRLRQTALLWPGSAGLWRDPDLSIALRWRENERPNVAWASRYGFAYEFQRAMEFLDASQAAALAESAQAARAREVEEQKEIELKRLEALAVRAEEQRRAEVLRLETEAVATERQIAEQERRSLRSKQRSTIALLCVVVAAMITSGLYFNSKKNENALAIRVREQAVNQINSKNGPLAMSALALLDQSYGPQDTHLIADSSAKSHEWIANASFALDEMMSDPANAASIQALRRRIAARISAASGITTTPGASDTVNPRIFIRGGTFMMGSDRSVESKTLHEVTVSPFWIQQHEVTNKEYRRFVPGHAAGKPDMNPATNVSWSDAAAYAAWLGGTLPTEAQWEMAARGTEGRLFPWGADTVVSCSRANFSDCAPASARAVIVGRENGRTPEGVYDLTGNVNEWCRDWAVNYSPGPVTDPRGPITGEYRVLRGGGFSQQLNRLFATERHFVAPNASGDDTGFRVVWRADSAANR